MSAPWTIDFSVAMTFLAIKTSKSWCRRMQSSRIYVNVCNYFLLLRHDPLMSNGNWRVTWHCALNGVDIDWRHNYKINAFALHYVTDTVRIFRRVVHNHLLQIVHIIDLYCPAGWLADYNRFALTDSGIHVSNDRFVQHFCKTISLYSILCRFGLGFGSHLIIIIHYCYVTTIWPKK